MNSNSWFIAGNKLPKQLSKQEVYELFEKMKSGDESARTMLIEHNIRLVFHVVYQYFNAVKYDKNDLVSIGNIGLIKAVSTFDDSKDVEFSSYAARCISNEILMFLRKMKKDENICSLDMEICHDKDDNGLKISDMLSDGTDVAEELIDNETYLIIRQLVNELSGRDREVIMLYFGFYDGKAYTQQEIADILFISRSYVSKVIIKNLDILRKQLVEKGILELNYTKTKKNKLESKDEGEDIMAGKHKIIYEYFSSNTKEEVNNMLEKLTEEERMLVKVRESRKLTKEETYNFYGRLMPKMRRLLGNPNRKTRSRKNRTSAIESVSTVSVAQDKNEVLSDQSNSMISEVIKQQDVENISKPTNIERITKEDYLKILEMLRMPNFTKMIDMHSLKEATIISLALGHVDGKCFSIQAIAKFLGIEEQEVRDIVRKVLFTYKKIINQIMDETIYALIEESGESSVVLNKSTDNKQL